MFPYMAKAKKKGKLGYHSNFEITNDSLLARCNSYLIIHQFQLSKFKKGENFMIPSLTQYNSYIIIHQFQLSKFKIGN